MRAEAYTRVRTPVLALRFAGDYGSASDVVSWVESERGPLQAQIIFRGKDTDRVPLVVVLRTEEGVQRVEQGDWVVRGPDGGFFRVKESVFKNHYVKDVFDE